MESEYIKISTPEDELIDAAVKANIGYTLLQNIATRPIPYKLCLAAVKYNAKYEHKYIQHPLQYIKQHAPEAWTPELLMTAVMHNCYAMKFIPPEEQTPELCMASIKHDPVSIQFIKMQTDEYSIEALKQGTSECVLQFLTTQTPELCQAAIEFNPKNIKYVKDEFMTSKLSLAAVKKDLNMIRYIPGRYQIPEIIKFIIEQRGVYLFEYIKPDNQTLELCEQAIKENPKNLRYVAPKWQTYEICKMALMGNQYNNYSQWEILQMIDDAQMRWWLWLFPSKELDPLINYLLTSEAHMA